MKVTIMQGRAMKTQIEIKFSELQNLIFRISHADPAMQIQVNSSQKAGDRDFSDSLLELEMLMRPV